MERKEGVVISISRTEGKGCIRVPGDFDHEFSLPSAPRRIKRDWSVSFVPLPGEEPDKPRAVMIRGIPKPKLTA